MDVAVIEDVAVNIQVVEGLGREDHGYIIAIVQQRHGFEKEGLTSHLQRKALKIHSYSTCCTRSHIEMSKLFWNTRNLQMEMLWDISS